MPGRLLATVLATSAALGALWVTRTGHCQPAEPQPTTRPADEKAGAAGGQPSSQPAPAPKGPTVYRMTVHARPATRPALANELLPDLLDREPGNAASVFMLTFARLSQVPADFYKLPGGQAAPSGADDKVSLYLELPAGQLLARRREAETFLQAFEADFRNADIAARRENCDWGLPAREEGFEMLLPHLNHARQLANLLAVRARLQVAVGDWAGARRTLQTGFALGRDMNAHGFLVQNLVGTGIGNLMVFHGVREWQQRPDAPNLYWGLASLPRPFMDFRGAMQWERATLVFTFPQLKKLQSGGGAADGGGYNEQDWRDFHDRLRRYGRQPGELPSNRFEDVMGPVAMAVLLYPQAKKHLVEWGWDEQKVRDLPVGQVLAEYEFGDYQRGFDELMKWANLPYWQAHAGMSRAAAEFRNGEPAGEVANPLLQFVPSVEHAFFTDARLDREIAAAQTVEALSDYAAGHDGKAPDKLEDLIDTPAPIDPITGKVFQYQVDRGAGGAGEVRVILNAPVPPGERATDAARYEVTIVKH